MNRPEALVVGGGPAGAGAALGLLRAGFSVTLLEQRAEWTGRLCGAFLSPEAARHLDWLGLSEEIAARGAFPAPHVDIVTHHGKRARLIMRAGLYSGMALPRRALEDVLLSAAARRGARIEMGWRGENFSRQGGQWQVRARHSSKGMTSFSAGLLVLAGGRFGLTQPGKASTGWFGWNAGFLGVPQKPGQLSLHFYPGGYVGTLTFADGATNVCGLHHKRAAGPLPPDQMFNMAMKRHAPFRRLMANAARQTPWRGVGPLPFGPKPARPDGAVLVGDASGVGDPYMGEGIGRALAAGPLIYDASQLNPQDLALKVHQLSRAYGSRWLIGAATRLALHFPSFLAPVLNLACRWPGALQTLTPVFHQGYAARGGPLPSEPADAFIPAPHKS